MSWPTEDFVRPKLTIQDIDVVLQRLRDRIEHHFENYGDGIFMHPHEIVGCTYGQQLKLSAAADATIYDGDLDEFEERVYKFLLALVNGAGTCAKLKELEATK